MLDKTSLQQEIGRICPDGHYHDMSVTFIDEVDAWRVDFTCHDQHLHTFLNESDARICTDKHHCLSIGLQLGEVACSKLTVH